MQGDLLFEYGHVMMNFLFTDPAYTPRKAEHYMKALYQSEMIDPIDIGNLPKLIEAFSAKDLVDYHRYDDNPPKTDLANLSRLYDIALGRMEDFFSSMPLLKTAQPQTKKKSGGLKPCF